MSGVRSMIKMAGLILVMILTTKKEAVSQNWAVDSIGVPDTAWSCTNTLVTVYTYLGCANFTDINQTDSVKGYNIGISLNKTTSMICFGALSWPSYTRNLGKLSAGTYTIKARGYNQSGSGITNTYTKTLVVLNCCPGASFNANFTVSDSVLCLGETINCTNTSIGNGIGSTWYVDGVQKATTTNYSTSFTKPGSYLINLVTDSGSNCTRNLVKEIVVNDSPVMNLGKDFAMCDGLSATLKAGSGWDSLLWSTGETTTNIVVQDSGNYSIVARDTGHCGLHYDTVHVALKPAPMVELGNDTVLCDGVNLLLDASNTNATYKWHNGSTGPALQISQPGKNWVEVRFNSNGCVTSDTINITYQACTGIEESVAENALVIRPNPFGNVIYVDVLSEKFPQRIGLYNIVGKRVAHLDGFSKTAQIRLDASHLESGIYLLHLEFEDEKKVFKLIKE